MAIMSQSDPFLPILFIHHNIFLFCVYLCIFGASLRCLPSIFLSAGTLLDTLAAGIVSITPAVSTQNTLKELARVLREYSKFSFSYSVLQLFFSSPPASGSARATCHSQNYVFLLIYQIYTGKPSSSL